MGFRKIRHKGNIIEYSNDWKGVETVFVNNQIESKKFSFAGTNHEFKIYSNGITVNYILTSRTGVIGNNVLDLRCDGKLIKKGLWVLFGTKTIEKNNFKVKGIKELNDYDTKEAIEYLNKALHINSTDPLIYFYLACCYSLEENPYKSFECIKEAVKHKLNNHDMILEQDMLSFARTHSEFEDFRKSNYKKLDKSKFSN